MKLTLKWPAVIITFIITLSLIYGANYWRQQNLVMEPLREELLAIEGIYDVKVGGGREKEITVYLEQVPQLAAVYRELEEILRSRNEIASTRVIIVDRRDSYLASLYNKIQFALMEGERKGNYTAMHREIDLLLEIETQLLSYSLSVDQERIYLQLSTADHYLYEVIPVRSLRN